MKKYVFKYFLLLAVIAVTILFWRQNLVLLGILSFLSIILPWIDNFEFVREYFAIAIFSSFTQILITNNSEAGATNLPAYLERRSGFSRYGALLEFCQLVYTCSLIKKSYQKNCF